MSGPELDKEAMGLINQAIMRTNLQNGLFDPTGIETPEEAKEALEDTEVTELFREFGVGPLEVMYAAQQVALDNPAVDPRVTFCAGVQIALNLANVARE